MYINNYYNNTIPRNYQWLNSDPKMLLFNGMLLRGSDPCSNISLNGSIEDLNLMKLGNDKTNNNLISEFSENVLWDISFETSAQGANT